MKANKVKYLILPLIAALLIASTSGLARESYPPDEPLVVPIGGDNRLWEMGDLEPGKPGGELSYSTENFPRTFNNLTGEGKTTKNVTKVIMGSGLTAENPVNGRIVPGLAKSWSITDDGREYTFYLRQGLKFSDGHPLTAEDVVFTYKQLIFNREIQTEKRAIIRVEGKLPTVEMVDKLSVKFTIPEPHGPFLRRMSTGIYPKHKFDGISGEEFTETWSRETAAESPEEIVGAGPFKLEKFNPEEEIVLTRNPYYYKVDSEGTQLPYIDRYRVLKVKDDDVEFLKFRSAGIDFIRAQIRDMPYLLSHADEENWNLITGKSSRTVPLNADFLTFNWNTGETRLGGLFRKIDFRRAVYLATDFEAIIEEAFNGFGQVQYGPISRLSSYHNPGIEEQLPVKQNAEQARELLEGLDIKDRNGDGKREFETGKTVSFGILVNEENGARKKMAEIIARNLGEVGLTVDRQVRDFEEYSSRIINGDFQATIASVLANAREPSTLSDIFTTGGPLHLWNLGPDRELEDWEKEIDNLFQKGLRTSNFSGRKEYYDRVQKIYAEKLPLIYLPGESFLYATAGSVKNWNQFNRLGSFLSFAEYVWVQQ